MGDFGLFLILGNAGFISSTVLYAFCLGFRPSPRFEWRGGLWWFTGLL